MKVARMKEMNSVGGILIHNLEFQIWREKRYDEKHLNFMSFASLLVLKSIFSFLFSTIYYHSKVCQMEQHSRPKWAKHWCPLLVAGTVECNNIFLYNQKEEQLLFQEYLQAWKWHIYMGFFFFFHTHIYIYVCVYFFINIFFSFINTIMYILMDLKKDFNRVKRHNKAVILMNPFYI